MASLLSNRPTAGLLSDTEAYYRSLTAYRDGDPNLIDNALRQLQGVGALAKPKTVHGEGRRRNVVWQATEVLDALDRFAERARRNPRSA